MIKDVADLFAVKGGGARAVLEGLKDKGKDGLDLAIDEAPKGSMRRSYLYVLERVFPLLMRIEDDGERYAALDDVCKALGLKVKDLRKALGEEEEKAKPTEKEEEEPKSLAPEPGTERHEKATELLGCPDILGKAAEDMERLGHVGEADTKKLALVCGVSARAGTPIQPSTHAQSSSGKNFLWDVVLQLLPPEKVVRRSALSAKALFRTQEDLRGAVLYFQEVVGSEDADFTIRVLQSDGRLEYEATETMPDGTLGTVVYRKEGPCVIVQTTTKNHLHPENETRVFPIYIDESEQQTRRIVESQLRRASGEGLGTEEREKILETWRDGVRLLEPAEVIIPFARRISMPSGQIRIRRDVGRVLDVIRVVCWLHQHQRERDPLGRIVALEEDFHAALRLVEGSLSRAWKSLTPAEEKVMDAINDLGEGLRTRDGFRKRDLRVPGVSERRLNEVLQSLTQTGYLDSDGRKGPQGYRYTVGRQEEKPGLGISLRPSPDGDETPIDQRDEPERAVPAGNRQVRDEDPEREAGANGREQLHQAEGADSRAEPAIERSAPAEGEENPTPAPDDDGGSGDQTAEVPFEEASEGKIEQLSNIIDQDSSALWTPARDLIKEGLFHELPFEPSIEEVEEAQARVLNM